MQIIKTSDYLKRLKPDTLKYCTFLHISKWFLFFYRSTILLKNNFVMMEDIEYWTILKQFIF